MEHTAGDCLDAVSLLEIQFCFKEALDNYLLYSDRSFRPYRDLVLPFYVGSNLSGHVGR